MTQRQIYKHRTDNQEHRTDNQALKIIINKKRWVYINKIDFSFGIMFGD